MTMRGVRLSVSGMLIAACFLGAVSVRSTAAVFTDQVSVAGNIFATPALAAPTGVNGSANCILAVRSNQVSWNASTHATLYLVERKLGTGSFVALTTTASTSITDLAVVGGTYQYRVIAQRELWSSPASSAVTLVQPGLCL